MFTPNHFSWLFSSIFGAKNFENILYHKQRATMLMDLLFSVPPVTIYVDCYYTDNLEADIKVYEEARAVLVVKPVYGCIFDRRIAFLQLRTGLTLELMERQACGKIDEDPLGPVISSGNMI